MDNLSKEKRSRIMRAIKGKHTKPEKDLRKVLARIGVKYCLHYGKEKIDIAIPSKKIAIFVDGCFWHKCPKHFKMPKSNLKYWKPKMERNAKRDKEKNKRLVLGGWKIIHIWEHEIQNKKLLSIKLKKNGLLATDNQKQKKVQL